MTRAKLAKRLLSLVLAVTVVGAGITVYSNQNVKDEVYAASAAPEIEKTEYEGKGKVDVEFYGKVKFYKAKVSVKKLSTGKVYSADILKKDSDDIEFKSPSYTAGCKYKYTISGIKKSGADTYTSVTGYFTVPKASSIKIEEIEYDAEDRELSVDFETKVSWRNPVVKVYNASGTYICKGRVLEKDNDSIEVRLSRELAYGKKYKCKITGIKAKSASTYRTVSKVFYAVD